MRENDAPVREMEIMTYQGNFSISLKNHTLVHPKIVQWMKKPLPGDR